MKKLIVLAVLCSMFTSFLSEAAVPYRGLNEGFNTQAIADSWWVYKDGSYWYPFWQEETDSFIWTSFQATGVFIFADSSSSDGRFTGNYKAAKIDKISAQVMFDYPSEVLGFSIYLHVVASDRYYNFDFSPPVDNSWYFYDAPLSDQNWYRLEGSNAVYGPPTDIELQNVDEVGVIAIPQNGLAYETYINIDNFALLPELVTPQLTIDTNGGAGGNLPRVKFKSEINQGYEVQYCDDLLLFPWATLPGYEYIVGDGSDKYVSDSLFGNMTFYRIFTWIDL